MKINDTFITQLRTFSLKKGRGQPRPFIYPLREWAICLLVIFFVALGLFGYAGFDFKSQLDERNVPLLTEEQIPRYRAEDAELIIRYYEGRIRTFDTLRSSRVTFQEPLEVSVPSEEVAR